MCSLVTAFGIATQWHHGLASFMASAALPLLSDVAVGNAVLNGCGVAVAWRQGMAVLQSLRTGSE